MSAELVFAVALALAVAPHLLSLAIVLLTVRTVLRLKRDHGGPLSWKEAMTAVANPPNESSTAEGRALATFSRRVRLICVLFVLQVCLLLFFIAL